MKIAYCSDWHLEHREKGYGVPADQLWVYGSFCLPKVLPDNPEVLIVAGDILPYSSIRADVLKQIEDHYGIPVLAVDGNHEFWGGTFPNPLDGLDYRTINGKTFAMATLWTRLNPFDEMMAPGWEDFKRIKGSSPALWNYVHEEHLKFLREAKTDVIITHHTPSYQSVPAIFAGQPTNCFFSNNLDFAQFPHCKLWVHGHTHTEFDYFVDETRVVCNPLGYPWERSRPGAPRFAIKVVEI